MKFHHLLLLIFYLKSVLGEYARDYNYQSLGELGNCLFSVKLKIYQET